MADKKGSSGGASGSTGRKKGTPIAQQFQPLAPGQFRTLNDAFEAQSYLDQRYQLQTLTPESAAELENYKGGGFNDMNASLRQSLAEGKVLKAAMKKRVKALDAAMKPLDESIVVYRGMNADSVTQQFYDGKLYSQDFIDGGFMSTSVDAQSAFKASIRMKIRVPKGTRAVVPDPKGNNGNENELLLDRGQRIRISNATRKTDEFGQVYIELEGNVVKG